MKRNDNYINPEEMVDFLRELTNAYDKAYYSLLYEGFTARQALEIKSKDVNKDSIVVNGESVRVSDQCLKYVKKSVSQDKYYRYNHLADNLIESPVYDTDYVIKFPIMNDQEPTTYEEKHYRMQRRLMGARKRSTFDSRFFELNIRQSGLVAKILPIIENCGGIEAAAKDEKFKEILQRWGKDLFLAKKALQSYGMEVE